MIWKFVFVSLCVCKVLCDISPTVKIARCRVQCLIQTLKKKDLNAKIGDGACFRRERCFQCWKMCSYLYYSSDLVLSMCNNTAVCQRGCRVACSFRENEPKGTIRSVWKFKKNDAHVEHFTNSHQIEVTWSRPEPDNIINKNDVIVFVLLFRDKSVRGHADWEEIQQTSSQEVLLQQDDLPRVPQFWLLAVCLNGTLADIKFDIDSSPIIQEISYSSLHGYSVKGNPPIDFESDSPLTLNVSLLADTTTGKTSALVEWDHPPIFFKDPIISYDVHLFFNGCNEYPSSSPPCHKTTEIISTVVISKYSQKPSRIYKNLLYNSIYGIRVDLTTKWYGTVQFKTLECPDVETKTYTVCPSIIALNNSNTTADGSIGYNIIDDLDYEIIDIMKWNISGKDMQYNEHSGKVSVLLAWSVPFNHSVISSYTIMCRVKGRPDIPSIIKKTNKTEEWFHLEAGTIYEIEGVAIYKGNKRNDEIQSDISILDTSISAIVRAQSVKSRQQVYWTNLDKLIVGITVVASVFLLGVIIIFVYKKRHTFKDIIITKPAVSKSNSYKSNVGCKVDYSNQLLLLSDEWELDPCRLKFCTPIGQGAFGKVVTGYYDNKKVAIKLVRDSAPLSYKEDLLAEINLMKRIGSHPNIVSMLGACTLSEPIALAMEYIPFGNLQNFLKKCRQDGDFHKRVGHPTEVSYSIMDPNGRVDNGAISPADMLSFARQVAMAMEYLAEKKYVHRDLAARNVLLDYDKVVKVCDFGLSRDIFTDNQYHKVTSGKLPLKWMAIESLRDRVFTTQSDVWSFGILMYEIVTMGGSPYPHTALADLYYVLANGYRMEKPGNCSDELYAIMRHCWLENPLDRPTFTDLRLQLEQLLSVDRNYLDLDNIDVPLSTSESSSNSVPKTDDRLSLISNRHAESSGYTVKTATFRPNRAIAIPTLTRDSVAVTFCREQPLGWLEKGRSDETST